MDPSQLFSNLKQVLGDAASGNADKTGALAISLRSVDQQIENVNKTQLSGGFEGSDVMQNGIAAFQEAVKPWPDVKFAIMGALQLIKAGTPIVNGLVTSSIFISEAGILQASMLALKKSMELANNALAHAMDKLQEFSGNLDITFREHAGDNQAALDIINNDQDELERKINDLNSKTQEAQSAKSIVLDVFTFGVKAAIDLNDINNQLEDCKDLAERIKHENSAYQIAWDSFNATRSATVLTSYTLGNIITVLQQHFNKLEDLRTTTSPNIVVMKAYLKTFQKEYQEVVDQIDA